MTLTFIILSGLYLRNHKVQELLLCGCIGLRLYVCNAMCELGVTFHLGSARMFSIAIFETYFYHIAYMDCFYLYLIGLSPLKLQLINRSTNRFYSFIAVTLQIYAVILFFHYLISMLCLYIQFPFFSVIYSPLSLHNLHCLF